MASISRVHGRRGLPLEDSSLSQAKSTNTKKSTQQFICATKSGTVMPGMKAEMIFEFTPQQLETVESLWTFSIPSSGRSQPFLLVGASEEPIVYLSPHHINFNARLLNKAVEEQITIINNEELPFSFRFDTTALKEMMKQFVSSSAQAAVSYSSSSSSARPASTRTAAARSSTRTTGATTEKPAEEVKPILRLSPTFGNIPPRSESTITITFIPQEEKDYNFNIPCIIERKQSRLNLNVKGEGYLVRDKLTLDPADPAKDPTILVTTRRTAALLAKQQISSGKMAVVGAARRSNNGPGGVVQQPADPSSPMLLDYGLVQMKDKKTMHFKLRNEGKYPLDFTWSLQRSSLIEGYLEKSHSLQQTGSSTQARSQHKIARHSAGRCNFLLTFSKWTWK